MSEFKLEKVVKELQNSIVNLTKKVDSLEKVILDQNLVIKSQTELLSKCSLPSINSNTLSCANKSEVFVNKPIRAAKLRAATMISGNDRSKRDGASESSSASTSKLSSENEERLYVSTANVNEIAPVSPVANEIVILPNSSEHWTEIRRNMNQAKVIRGSAAPGTLLLEPSERWKYFHLYYVKNGTTDDIIKEHLKTVCLADVCTVESLKSRGNYASFKIGVPVKQSERMLHVSSWPEDVCIKPWRNTFRNSKGQ